MSQSQKSTQLDFARLTLGVTWKTVLFPFDQWTLFSVLPRSGYTLVNPQRLMASNIGSLIEVSGTVATKGADIRLSLNFDRPQLVVEGPSPQLLADEFSAVETLLKTELKFDSEAQSRGYEVDALLLIRTGSSPSEAFGRFWSGFSRMESIGPLIGIGDDCTNLSLRLGSSQKSLLEQDWFEIGLQPSNRSPETTYSCTVVFRHPQKSKVLDFLGNLETTVEKLLSHIEIAK